MQPARILVVADDPDLRSLWDFALSCRGHDVNSGADGADALSRLQGFDAAVVVTELRLDGGGLLAALRGGGQALRQPVIAVTRLDAGDPRLRPFRGVPRLRLLHRPIEVGELTAAVEAALITAAPGLSLA